jgi:hypothetical protein
VIAEGSSGSLHAASNIALTQHVARHWLRVHSFAPILLPSFSITLRYVFPNTALVDFPIIACSMFHHVIHLSPSFAAQNKTRLPTSGSLGVFSQIFSVSTATTSRSALTLGHMRTMNIKTARYSLMLTLGLCVATIAVSGADEQPKVPDHVVLKPTFMTGHDSFSGGTAFLCVAPDSDEVLLLTAHHLFGEACGLDREFTWQEMPKTFVAVTGLSITDPTRYITSTKPLTIPGAHGLDSSGYHNDLAGYRVVTKPTLSLLRLATSRPKVGATVFLHARQRGKSTLDVLKAVVRKSTDTEFEYVFEASKLNTAGTSGAPVLNTLGEVVAINIGGGQEAGKNWGMGNPCSSIIRLLKSAK